MKKASIIIHQDYVEDAIKRLHETGLMEIIEITSEEDTVFSKAEGASQHPDAGICANYELRITRLIDILKKIKSSKSGIKALLKPELPEIKTIERCSLDEIISYAEGLLGDIEQEILSRNEKIEEIEEEIEEYREVVETLKYLKDFDLKLTDLKESNYLFTVAGKTDNFESLSQEIKGLNYVYLSSKQFGTGKKAEWAVILLCHKNVKDKIEKIVREYIETFELPEISETPDRTLKRYQGKIKNLKKEKKEIVSKLQKYSKDTLDGLLALREEIQLEKVRKEISKNFAKTDYTYMLKGWVVEDKTEELEEELAAVSDGNLVSDFEEPSVNPDDPPTYVDIPWWGKPFKDLVGMFATPKYDEIDPSIPMGIFFVLFFGFMLGDAGYGLTILFLSLLGFYKLGRYSETIKNWSFMGIWLGLATTFVGFLTNSFFGNLISKFFLDGNALYNVEVMGVSLPVGSLDSPITILSVALILGIVHLNLGIILGLYQAYRRGDFKKMFTERVCWIPMQIGGGLLIGSSILNWDLSAELMYVGGILTIIGLILLIVDSGPVGFFDITGYVGDWLSYARLLALGLATAGMALAFNEVGGLLSDMIPVVGIILLPIILVIAHLINLGLQALGAGVHSLRLQYVEFFNRFYEGGGHEFSPFKIKRKYTRLKEEKTS
ncbi:MAG: V-type ATP synthase subunit I [Candidatus Thermoplasmatota archaeon]